MTIQVQEVKIRRFIDDDFGPESDEQITEEIRASYGKEWNYLFIQASVTLMNTSTRVTHVISSGGCGGVYSNSEEQIKEVAQEEIMALKNELDCLGINVNLDDTKVIEVET